MSIFRRRPRLPAGARPPLASTVRAFAANTFDMHMGIQPCDPGALADEDGDGFSRPTNAGCPQPAAIDRSTSLRTPRARMSLAMAMRRDR